MVCFTEIKFDEDGGSLDGFEDGQDEWQRIFVLDGDLIQALIVNAIFFSTKKNTAPTGEEDGLTIPTAKDSRM